MAKEKTEEEKFLIGRRKLKMQIKRLNDMVIIYSKIEGLNNDTISVFNSAIIKLRKSILKQYREFLYPEEKLMEVILKVFLDDTRGIEMHINNKNKGILEQLKNTKK